MPYTEAQISNMALGHVGVQGYISSLENDKSNEARACRLYFAHSRDVILEMMLWPFATVRAELQQQDGVTFDGWGFSYVYPNDCAFAASILLPGLRNPPADSKPKFKIVRNPQTLGKLILTDMEQAGLEYNLRVTDPAEFDATFAHAQSLLLGTLIGGPLRADANLIKLTGQAWIDWQAEAGIKTLREQREDTPAETDLVSVRG